MSELINENFNFWLGIHFLNSGFCRLKWTKSFEGKFHG